MRRLAVHGMLIACLAGAGCGAERSPDAYCRAFYAKATPIRDGYVEARRNAEENPFGVMAKVLSAPGDLAVIFDGMVDHAPDEIRADTAAARDALRRQQAAVGDLAADPMSGLVAGLFTGLTSAGSFERVNEYLARHCPPSSALAREYRE
jgi:hypothetical protein